ncbi:unnamed protein product [Spirodela intermedia]|uniref:RRM domain-containing protein n=1 Tax=Spirodela intermedia TaxID=51605 RepID=A0A7I8J712_SPIIN|nr:unnamed protein product [Spirodela intermedia]CAA6665844.1 unnamed protein product [Spirodela intermedia]
MDLSSKKRKVEENGGIDAGGAPPSKLTPRTLVRSSNPSLESSSWISSRRPRVGMRTCSAPSAQTPIMTRPSGNCSSAALAGTRPPKASALSLGSRGYGFITFRHIDGALLALKEPSKKIDGRMTVTQLAASGVAGPTAAQPSAADVPLRKIYVGSVPHDMPAERLLAHFSSYGEIEEGPLGFDKQTGKSRGFALFVYKSVDGAKASLVDPTKVIDGHTMLSHLMRDILLLEFKGLELWVIISILTHRSHHRLVWVHQGFPQSVVSRVLWVAVEVVDTEVVWLVHIPLSMVLLCLVVMGVYDDLGSQCFNSLCITILVAHASTRCAECGHIFCFDESLANCLVTSML